MIAMTKPASVKRYCSRGLLAFLLALSLLVGIAGRASAAVSLVSFTATGQSGSILVEWKTATELDNAGFYIQASDQENGTYTRISGFIWAKGDGLTGATYSYTDDNVSAGQTRWYKLESVNNSQVSEFDGPISAAEGAGTPTSTATSVETSTPTETQSNSTSTSTATLTPTSTDTSAAYPAPATATPSPAYPGIATTAAPVNPQVTTALQASATPRSQGTVITQPTGTAVLQGQGLTNPNTNQEGTFVPLPSISIQYVDGMTGTPELTASANPALNDDLGQSGSSSNWSRYGTLGFILIIWVLLGGWFWLSFRKLD